MSILGNIKTTISNIHCPCNNQELNACLANLGSCQDSLGKAQLENSQLQQQLRDANVSLATLTDNLKDCNTNVGKAQQAYALLTNGPPAPQKANLRVLSAINLQSLLVARIGQPFLDCLARGGVHYAWPPWLICPQNDIYSYLEFYNANILPLLQPYTVLDWTDTHGNKLQISGRTCSDFSAFFWGLSTLYLGWTPLAWGVIWAYVESLFLSGGHAFNFVVCWAPPFVEDPNHNAVDGDGLSLLEIEPQTSGRWTAAGVALDDTAKIERLELKPITPKRFSGITEGYKINAVYNVTA